MFRSVPLSIIRSFSLYTQQWYISYRFAVSFAKYCLEVQEAQSEMKSIRPFTFLICANYDSYWLKINNTKEGTEALSGVARKIGIEEWNMLRTW